MTAATMNGTTLNGHVNGQTNGEVNGHVNGQVNGHGQSPVRSDGQKLVETKILIVGAGPAGASLACFLASYGNLDLLAGGNKQKLIKESQDSKAS